MMRAIFVVLLSAIALVSGGWTRGGGSLSSNGGMLIGLSPPAYYNNNPPFLNWAVGIGGAPLQYALNKSGGGTMPLADAYTNGLLDSNGELIAGAGLSAIASINKTVFTPLSTAPNVPVLATNPWWQGLQMKVTWTGSATVALSGSLGTGGTALSCSGNSCSFTFGSNPLNVALVFTLTNVSDPPKNIFVYEAQYQSQVTALASCTPNLNCNHFRPVYLTSLGRPGRIRSMDWGDANGSGLFDLSVMADFNYQICVACAYGGLAVVNGSSISGTTLTTGSDIKPASTIGLGEVVNNSAATVTAGTIVVGNSTTNSNLCSPACTGSGSVGTYAVNNSQTVASSTFYFSAASGYVGPPLTGNGSGPKGGVHPSVLIELARLTGADIYYNLPVNITDAGMLAIAQYFRDNLPLGIKVFFEFGNEDWNSSLGVTFYWLNAAANNAGGFGGSGVQYAGYRMAQLMLIARNAFGTNAYNRQFGNTNSRWGGIVGGQMKTGSPTTATTFITGFNQWQTATSSTYNINNLFSEIVVAPYFSDFPSTVAITAVSPGATTTVTAANSFTVGQVKRLYFGNTGAGTVGSVLNNQNVTITARTATNFSFTNIDTTGLTYSSAGASDFVADGNLMNMVDASVACGAASTTTATGTLSGNALTLSGISGSVVAGMGVTGSGIPQNTYINSGSGSSWVTNNSATAGPVSVTLSPCATQFQFFSQQWSKLMITGANDFGYTGSATFIPQTGFPAIFSTYALLANSYGLSLSEYEGGNQLVIGGQLSTLSNFLQMEINWKWDAAGNDPLYTPAKVYLNQFQMLRNVKSAYSAQYMDNAGQQGMAFSGLRYYGDSNPTWSAIVAENALGPYVDPPSPASWTANYPGSGTNYKIMTNSCASPCTDTLTGAVIGTAATRAIVIAAIGQSTITSATCDGVTSSTPDASSVGASGGRSFAIFSMALGAGANTRNCSVTYTTGNGGSPSFQTREFYVMTVTGLTSGTPAAVASGSTNFQINYNKNGLLVVGSSCAVSTPFVASSGVQTPTASSPTTATLASDHGTLNQFALLSAPFSSSVFLGVPGCTSQTAGAVYN